MPTQGDTIDDGRYVYDATDGSYERLPAVITKVLTADETAQNADTTVAEATGLATAIAASETRVVEFVIFYTAAAAADLKVQVDAPSGAVGSFSIEGLATDATTGEDDVDRAVTSLGSSDIVGGAGTGTEIAARVTATVINSTTSGEVTFSWAQGTSDASDATVKAYSSARSYRVE